MPRMSRAWGKRVRARRLVTLSWLSVALVLAGCSPATGVELGPALTPPLDPGPVIAQLEAVDNVGMPGGRGELVAVAAGPDAVVAVGSAGDPQLDGPLILRSTDALRWSRVGPALGLDLFDVAHGPNGFVAVGTLGDDANANGSAFLHSVDGLQWDLLPPEASAGVSAYVWWVSGGEDGYRAGGMARDGRGLVSWTSSDGLVWTVDDQAVEHATPVGAGWIETSASGIRVVPAGIAPGTVAWASPEEPPGDRFFETIQFAIPVGSGYLAATQGSRRCDLISTCSSSDDNLGWWSEDGVTWRLIPTGEPGWPNAWVSLLAAGKDGTALVLDDKGLEASLDGWHWSVVVPVGDQVPVARDAVPFRDGVVLVDARATGENGMTMTPWAAFYRASTGE